MSYFAKYLRQHLESSGVSAYRLALESCIGQGLMSRVLNGDRRPTDEFIEKVVASKMIPSLTNEMLLSWRALDDYGGSVLKMALLYLNGSC